MTNSDMSSLDQARAVLTGTIQVPEAVTTRVAAFLARRALEDAVMAWCRTVSVHLDRTTMRSKLIVIRVLHGEEIANVACAAWAGLSQACHYHAYELAPSAAQLRRLLDLVARVAALGPDT